jgi:hypothetical protein
LILASPDISLSSTVIDWKRYATEGLGGFGGSIVLIELDDRIRLYRLNAHTAVDHEVGETLAVDKGGDDRATATSNIRANGCGRYFARWCDRGTFSPA